MSEGHDYSYFADRGQAVEESHENEFIELEDDETPIDKHYCPDCYHVNQETDEITIKL